MENFVCKGQLFFSTGPNGHRCIPNGFLVCTEGLCQGAFPVLPEAYRDLPLLDFGDGSSSPDWWISTSTGPSLPIGVWGWTWSCWTG